MRFVLATWGSRGDCEPFLALAVACVRAGHHVVLGAPPNAGFAAAAAHHSVSFIPLGPALDGGETRHDRSRAAATASEGLRMTIEDHLVPNLESMHRDLVNVGQDADIIIAHSIQPAGRMAAESLRLPFVSATMVPGYLPTRYRSPPGIPNLGPWVNRLIWQAGTRFGDRHWAPGVNQVRVQVGLLPLRNLCGDTLYSPDLNLVVASPSIWEAPPD